MAIPTKNETKRTGPAILVSRGMKVLQAAPSLSFSFANNARSLVAKAWLAGFLSELHRDRLKTLGFGKERSTFSRDRGEYVERFNFQGSMGSSAAETRFYVNVGIEFVEYGPAETNWVYFKRTHWACRIDELEPEAPKDWRCSSETDTTALKAEVAALIESASKSLASRKEEFRKAYLDYNRKG
jgi:Domain of unknown function (DUF4304)